MGRSTAWLCVMGELGSVRRFRYRSALGRRAAIEGAAT